MCRVTLVPPHGSKGVPQWVFRARVTVLVKVFRVQSLDFRVQSSEFRVSAKEFRVQSSDFRVQSLEFRVQPKSSEFRIRVSTIV